MRFIPGTSFLVSELLPHFDSAARTLGRVPSYRNQPSAWVSEPGAGPLHSLFPRRLSQDC